MLFEIVNTGFEVGQNRIDFGHLKSEVVALFNLLLLAHLHLRSEDLQLPYQMIPLTDHNFFVSNRAFKYSFHPSPNNLSLVQCQLNSFLSEGQQILIFHEIRLLVRTD